MINLLNDIKEIVKSDKEHRIAIMVDSVYIDIKLIYDPERTFEESCFFIPIRYSSLEGYSYIDNSQYKENYKNTDIGINLEEIKLVERIMEYLNKHKHEIDSFLKGFSVDKASLQNDKEVDFPYCR